MEIDEIVGGEGNNIIFGDNGSDTILGGSGNDVLIGGNGHDAIMGQLGNDKIYHGAMGTTASDGNKDVITCGEGNDEVWINTSIDGDEYNGQCESIHDG